MRLLLLNQFYPPDVAPTGQFLHDLARTLVERGHGIDVLCSSRPYALEDKLAPRDLLEGVRIRRVGGPGLGRRGLASRAIDALGFLLRVAWVLLRDRPRPDVIVALTSPPWLGVVPALLSRRSGTPWIQWTMDVYPDVLEAQGLVRQEGPAGRLLAGLSRWQLRSARLVIGLGPHMCRRLETYLLDSRPLAVALWGEGRADATETEACRQRRGWTSETTVLLYSGNLGLGHRFGEFLEAAHRLGPGGPLWAFAGDGPRRPEVESFAREHPEARLQLLPYVPRGELPASLAAADVHLASLSAPWQGCIVPSKIPGIFAAGRPVILVGPPDNEAAEWIAASGGGWVVPEGDIEGLLEAVAEAGDPEERERRGRAAEAYAEGHFGRAANCRRLAEAIEAAS